MSVKSRLDGCLVVLHRWLFQLFSWLVTVVFGIGLVLLWRVPLAARQHGVEQSDVVLRGIDYHEAEPFHLLKGYRPTVASAVIERLRDVNSSKSPSAIQPLRDLSSDRVETVQKGPHEYEHEIFRSAQRDKGAEAGTCVTSTTPHTQASPEQLLAARRGLDAMYPPADGEARQQLLEWGETLFVQWWAAQVSRKGEQHIAIAPERGTEEEHLWFAWQRLTDGDERAARDLPGLAALARQAYPDESDYQAAVAWAHTWYARQQEHFAAHQAWLNADGAEGADELLVRSLKTVLPPPTEATWHWLLYQCVGLDETSRRAARQRWMVLLGAHKLEDALRWGRELEQQRRGRADPLPPPGDEVALLCVVERLAGTDDYAQRCRLAARQAAGDNSLVATSVRGALQIAYPSDDVYYVLCGGNPLELGIYGGEADLGMLGQVFCLLALIAVIAWYFRHWLLNSVGPWILWLRRNQAFIRYRERETHFAWEWKGLVGSYVLVPLLLWGVAWLTLSRPVQMLVATPWHLLAGVYVSVLVGGTAIVCLNRVMSLLFIRFGYDVEKIWLDDVLGVVVGVAVLYFFGNDVISLAAFVAFAVLPELMRRRAASAQPGRSFRGGVTRLWRRARASASAAYEQAAQ